MTHYVKNKIVVFVVLLGACVIAIVCAGSFASAQESYQFNLKWGSAGSGDGQFNNPEGIDNYDTSIYVADQNNNRVQKFTLTGSFQAKYGPSLSGDGQFNHPAGVFCDVGNLAVYVADKDNNQIKKLNTGGSLITSWGSLGSGEGQLSHPFGVAKMPGIGGGYASKVYVTDTGNNRIQIFSTTGTFYNGWGSAGSQNGQFNSPRGIAIDSTGYVYVADYNNNRVQKFNFDGTFVTAWGSLGSGNGQLNGPYYIALDKFGAVYVTDSNNHRVQKFDSNGGFIGAWGSNGTGDGQFNTPKGICIYNQSNTAYVFVVDSGNNRIQKFLVTIGTGTTTTAQGSSTTTSIQGDTSTVPGSTTTISGGTTTTISGGTTTISGGTTTTTISGGATTTVSGGTTTTIPGGNTTTIIPGQVVADFTASPTEGYRPLTVSFSNLSQGDIVTYLWYFGDGQESGQKDPVHIYQKKGTYSVILKVFGKNDTQDSKAKDSYIVVKSRCIFIQSLNNNDAVDTIRLLKNILLNNPYGAYLASMYYKNADEISDILDQDPALQDTFRTLVRENLAMAEECINYGEASVSAQELDKVIAFLLEVQAKGSPALQTDIDIVVMEIKRGYLLKGLRIKID